MTMRLFQKVNESFAQVERAILSVFEFRHFHCLTGKEQKANCYK